MYIDHRKAGVVVCTYVVIGSPEITGALKFVTVCMPRNLRRNCSMLLVQTETVTCVRACLRACAEFGSLLVVMRVMGWWGRNRWTLEAILAVF